MPGRYFFLFSQHWGMGFHLEAMHTAFQKWAEGFARGKVYNRLDKRLAFAHRGAATGIVFAEVNISRFQRKSLIEFVAEESLAASFPVAFRFLVLRFTAATAVIFRHVGFPPQDFRIAAPLVASTRIPMAAIQLPATRTAM